MYKALALVALSLSSVLPAQAATVGAAETDGTFRLADLSGLECPRAPFDSVAAASDCTPSDRRSAEDRVLSRTAPALEPQFEPESEDESLGPVLE